jgi:hypothetical protein
MAHDVALSLHIKKSRALSRAFSSEVDTSGRMLCNRLSSREENAAIKRAGAWF